MELSSWLRGASTTVVGHRSPDAENLKTVDQSLQEIQGGQNRIQRLLNSSGVQNVRRSVAFLGAGVMLASSPAGAIPLEAVESGLGGLDQSQIQQVMSPASKALNKAAGAENLTIVSQDDVNLKNIIARMDSSLLPDVRPLDMPDKSPEHDAGVKRTLLAQYFDERVDRAHAAYTAEHVDGERVCFVQDTVPNQIKTDYGLPLVIGDKEMSLGILSHELAHCQDFNDVAVKDDHGHVIDEERQREVVADLTASLLVASHTKNWDFVDYSLKPMRVINVDNTDHATTQWLDNMRYTTDLDSLQPLSQKEAFELAQSKYEKMNYHMIQDRNIDDWVLNKGYKKALDGGVSWDQMPQDFQEHYQYNLGVSNQAELMPKLEEHGKSQIRTYLNHVNYKSLEGDEKTANELLSYLDKHAKSFGDNALSNEVDIQRQSYQTNGSLDVVALGQAADVLIDQKAKLRFENNREKMANIDRGFYPQEVVTGSLPESVDPFIEVKKESEATNAKENFVEKIKIAERELENDERYEPVQPG